MASYPPRRASMLRTLARLAPQVDRVNLVLNRYDRPPDELAAWANVEAVLPGTDTRAAGKYLVEVAANDLLLTLDDDIVLPADYVARSVAAYETLGDAPAMASYHGTIYRRPRWLRSERLRRALGWRPGWIVGSCDRLHLTEGQDEHLYVDQLGTGVAIMRGRWVPPFSEVESAPTFVDARLARLCHERGIARICLARPAGWLGVVKHAEDIYGTYTRQHPAELAAEIRHYAFRDPRVGKPVPAGSVSGGDPTGPEGRDRRASSARGV